jgi:HEPN domain-containing protein
MRPPEDVKLDLVRQWLFKAEEDLGVAKVLFSSKTSFFATIGFHCQQAVEKFLKAFLTWHQIEFPKTHDLVMLVNLAAAVDSLLGTALADVVALNPYGVDVRYPGDFLEITLAETEEAIQLAEKARTTILQVLMKKIAP